VRVGRTGPRTRAGYSTPRGVEALELDNLIEVALATLVRQRRARRVGAHTTAPDHHQPTT